MCITAHSSHYITDFFFGRKTSLRHEKFLPTNDFLTKLSAVCLRNAPLLHAYPIRTTLEVHHHQRNPFLFHYPPFSSPEICGNRSKHPSTCLGMNLTCVCACVRFVHHSLKSKCFWVQCNFIHDMSEGNQIMILGASVFCLARYLNFCS